jgi:hypothetical protein
MLARIAVMKALNWHSVKAPSARRRKPAKVGLFGDRGTSDLAQNSPTMAVFQSFLKNR